MTIIAEREQPVKSGIRYRASYGKDDNVYVTVFDREIICSALIDQEANAILTCLTRVISVALQNGVTLETIKKQLKASTLSSRDIPAILLDAIEEWEKNNV